MTITPVDTVGGRHYKRDDLNRHASGVNGGKWRQCEWLLDRIAATGATEVVSGASILSPQLAMTAVAAKERGIRCTLVIGADLITAIRQPSVRIAAEWSATFERAPVAYNPALQAAVRRLAEERSAPILHYGVSLPDGAPVEHLRQFHSIHDDQVADLLTRDLRSLVIPFGSGNTAASILYSLARADARSWPGRVVLVGIGPSRYRWLQERLTVLGVAPARMRALLRHVLVYDLHGTGEVTYQQKVSYTSDGIPLHPTYEAKVARWVDSNPERVPGWTDRDGSAAFWIVGAPVG